MHFVQTIGYWVSSHEEVFPSGKLVAVFGAAGGRIAAEVTTYLLRFPPAIYERLANPSERPMTAFSFECGVGSEKPSKALLGFHS